MSQSAGSKSLAMLVNSSSGGARHAAENATFPKCGVRPPPGHAPRNRFPPRAASPRAASRRRPVSGDRDRARGAAACRRRSACRDRTPGGPHRRRRARRSRPPAGGAPRRCRGRFLSKRGILPAPALDGAPVDAGAGGGLGDAVAPCEMAAERRAARPGVDSRLSLAMARSTRVWGSSGCGAGAGAGASSFAAAGLSFTPTQLGIFIRCCAQAVRAASTSSGSACQLRPLHLVRHSLVTWSPGGSCQILMMFSRVRRIFREATPLRYHLLRCLDQRLNFLQYPAKLYYNTIERPWYGHCLLHAAQLARKLGHKRISAIEFGVAGGNGLLALERHAAHVTRETGVDVAIFGFDTGKGMPQPLDHRDMPYMWQAGYFAMDAELLQARLRSSKLLLGPVETTLRTFFEKEVSSTDRLHRIRSGLLLVDSIGAQGFRSRTQLLAAACGLLCR